MTDTNRILSEIRAYLRISAAAASRTSASEIFDCYEKALVYSKLDGNASQNKIEQDTKVPQATICRWLETFVQGRLVSPPDEYNPSYKALFTLQELGIKLEALKKRTRKGTEGSPEATAEQQENLDEATHGTIEKYFEEKSNGPAK